jgi:membrane-associated PAP2 superfamily phosphatase
MDNPEKKPHTKITGNNIHRLGRKATIATKLPRQRKLIIINRPGRANIRSRLITPKFAVTMPRVKII